MTYDFIYWEKQKNQGEALIFLIRENKTIEEFELLMGLVYDMRTNNRSNTSNYMKTCAMVEYMGKDMMEYISDSKLQTDLIAMITEIGEN